MLLVIFGAGASFDSVPHFGLRASDYEESRPPLANELFSDRPSFVTVMRQFADCLPLIPRLRGEIQVEQQLARFQEQAGTYPVRYRQLAAIRYYLQVMLSNCQEEWLSRHNGVTNYATLLDEIERWRFEAREKVCFVTFNYDTMLEEAMQQVLRFNIRKLTDYVDQENYVLLKLHGSTNWGRFIEGGLPYKTITQANQLIDAATELKLSDSYTLAHGRPILHHNEQPVFPALAIPVEKKDSFECPQEHIALLASLIPRVTKIITIGWRATEERFLEMLRSRLTGLAHKIDLLIVSGSPSGADETFKNLGITVAADGYAPMTSGFTGLTQNLGMLDALLRQSPWQKGR